MEHTAPPSLDTAKKASETSVWAGFITYGELTAPYLKEFLASLAAQTGVKLQVIAFDNTPEVANENSRILKEHSAIEVLHEGENIGFSRAYNRMIARAAEAGADYFLAINPDTLLEPDTVAKLLAAIQADLALASAAPKIRQWNFKEHIKTDIIDSCGLRLGSALHFSDIGQGENDRGQYDEAKIIGPSGAAGLYRISALQAAAENGQYFDEHFFMYKEDCDLAYRLALAGFGSKLVSEALVYHDRTATGGSLGGRLSNRFSRSRNNRRWAFLNQHFLFIKFWGRQNFRNKLLILIHIKMRFLAALLLEPYLLKEYKALRALKPSLRKY